MYLEATIVIFQWLIETRTVEFRFSFVKIRLDVRIPSDIPVIVNLYLAAGEGSFRRFGSEPIALRNSLTIAL